jgi:WD40 repeat protein
VRPEFHPGPTDSLGKMALSSDGTRALSGGSDGVGRLWDLRTGLELRRLEGHAFAVDAVAMTSDAGRAITSSEQTLLLWDLANGAVLKRVPLPSRLIRATLSADSNTVFAVAFDRVLLIDLRSEPRVQVLGTATVGAHSPFVEAAMTPDARWAISWGIAETNLKPNLKLWDLRDLQTRTTVASLALGSVLGISPDGKTALAGDPVCLWNLASGQELHRFENSRRSGAMTPDGRFALIATTGNQVEYWDLQTLRRITTIPGNDVRAIAGDGRTGVIVGLDGVATLWDLRTAKQVRQFAPPLHPVISVVQTPDAGRILFASFDSAHLWDKKAGREIRTLDCAGTGQGINSVALSGDGARALLGCQHGAAKLIDLRTGQEIRTVAAGLDLAFVSMTPDANLGVVSAGGAPSIWDLAAGAEVGRIPGQPGRDFMRSMALSADGRFLLTVLSAKSAQLWNLQTRTEIRGVELPPGQSYEQFRSVAMTADARWAVLGSTHSTARLWDLQSGKDVWTMQKGDDYNHSVDTVALTPDGNLAVTGIGGDSAQLWDVRAKKAVARFRYPEQGAFKHSAITADGRFVTALIGPAIRIWSANGSSWLTLYSYRGGWAAIDDQGRYDASDPQNCPAIYGLAGGAAVALSELKAFYTPGLVTRFFQ